MKPLDQRFSLSDIRSVRRHSAIKPPRIQSCQLVDEGEFPDDYIGGIDAEIVLRRLDSSGHTAANLPAVSLKLRFAVQGFSNSRDGASPLASYSESIRAQSSSRLAACHVILRAWSVFVAGLLGTVLIGATILAAGSGSAVTGWYALVAITFLVGVPVGVYLSFLVVPAARNDRIQPSGALERSAVLTRGIKLALLWVALVIVAFRWVLQLLASWLLSRFVVAYHDSNNLVTFQLFPSAIFVLDALIGPSW